MFDSVLIANRGEVALRIQRACRLLGLRTIAVFSEADRDSTHVRLADRAVCIGPAPARASYLNQEAMLLAAELTGAGAIHPGYGFLSENAEFAARVEAAGLVFIGPRPATIATMGDKIAAKRAMQEAGVPCVPGPSAETADTPEALRAAAATLGYPVILKAAAGGGGRGMRVVADEQDVYAAITLTRAEAEAAFGRPDLYLEKFLDRPRHIEIQILCDNHGNAIHLGERDCSIQRRHQKLLEESPAPGISRRDIAALGDRCTEACRRIGYRGLGTLEFLYQDGVFAFIEMNTRMQVEHPVTEMATGIDLVQAQIRAALNETATLHQADIRVAAHAIECRINAEDSSTGLPSPGIVTRFDAPGGFGIRLDSHMRAGAAVPAAYNSLMGKLIAWGATRDEAIARAQVALSEVVVEGVATNIALHQRILSDTRFRQGSVDITYLRSGA